MKEYVYIVVPFISLIVCQIIKFSIESFKNKRLEWGRLFNGAGGMPSTHTTFSISLTTLIGYTIGINECQYTKITSRFKFLTKTYSLFSQFLSNFP